LGAGLFWHINTLFSAILRRVFKQNLNQPMPKMRNFWIKSYENRRGVEGSAPDPSVITPAYR